MPFSISQLINADTVYNSFSGYEARALIYQKILLSDNLENKLNLLFVLKDLFEKDNFANIYRDFLSNELKQLKNDEIPESYKK